MAKEIPVKITPVEFSRGKALFFGALANGPDEGDIGVLLIKVLTPEGEVNLAVDTVGDVRKGTGVKKLVEEWVKIFNIPFLTQDGEEGWWALPPEEKIRELIREFAV